MEQLQITLVRQAHSSTVTATAHLSWSSPHGQLGRVYGVTRAIRIEDDWCLDASMTHEILEAIAGAMDRWQAPLF